MILELIQKGNLRYDGDDSEPVALEQRVSAAALQSVAVTESQQFPIRSSQGTVGDYIIPLSVNRAASSSAMAKIEDFYVAGMGTTKSHDSMEANGVVKKCFLWPGATVEICYTQRAVDATKGSFTVSKFEDMLNTVHKNILGSTPFCGQDKWWDNHYAIDTQSADEKKIIDYINQNSPYHHCTTSGFFGQKTTLAAVIDPCGWGIQLDINFHVPPKDCHKKPEQDVKHLGRGTFNPVCTLDFTVCPKEEGSQSTLVV